MSNKKVLVERGKIYDATERGANYKL